MAQLPDCQNTTFRKGVYESLIPKIQALLDEEKNLIAKLANLAAVLKEELNFFWIGYYLIDKADELVLGPFQGTPACMRIKKGKGVCGMAWQKEETIIVPNVHEFANHIACSPHSQSEIVVPFYTNRQIKGVLDIDSDKLDDFTQVDSDYLNKIHAIVF